MRRLLAVAAAFVVLAGCSKAPEPVPVAAAAPVPPPVVAPPAPSFVEPPLPPLHHRRHHYRRTHYYYNHRRTAHPANLRHHYAPPVPIQRIPPA